MAYALLAQLTPEYGLYTSFIALCLYWAFATSKDITIGVPILTLAQSLSRVVWQRSGGMCPASYKIIAEEFRIFPSDSI
jgi:MFS superfamily sulfate permease-like transporter